MARQIVTQEMQQAEREKRLAQARNILPTATGGAAKGLSPLIEEGDYVPKPLEMPQAAPTLPAEQSAPQDALIRAMQETGSTEQLLPTTQVGTIVDPLTLEEVDATTDQGKALLEETQRVESVSQERAAPILQPERIVPDQEGELQIIPPTTEFETAQELLDKPEINQFLDNAIDRTASSDSISELANLGTQFRFKLQDQMQPVLADNSEISLNVRNELMNADLLADLDSPMPVLKQTLANSVAVAGVLIGHDMITREDTERTQRGKRGDLKPNTFIETTKGVYFTPDSFRNGMAAQAFNLIGPNPNAALEAERDAQGNIVEGGVRTGFGGYGNAMDPTTRSAFDGIFNTMLSEDGWFDYIWEEDVTGERTPENASYVRLSERGADIVRRLTPLMQEMGLIPEVNISYTPTVAGQGFPGRAMESGRRYAGNISKTNKSDSNTAKEDAIKTILGSTPQKIVEARFEMAKLMVRGLVAIDQAGRVIFKHPSADGNFYSGHERFADTLGIGKTKWYEHYSKALRTLSEADARSQANMIMAQRARQLIKTIQQGEANGDKVFYNKWMHATSVGRYFVRNTVLNPQNNKLVRMFVGNPRKVILNPAKDRSTKLFKDWAYIIGYNLLDTVKPDDAVSTENRGWDSITNEALSIIRDPNSDIYKQWVSKGKAIVEMLAQNKALQDPARAAELRAKINAALGPEDSAQEVTGLDAMEAQYGELLDEFTKSGEWGYPFQSYIDMYNYDQALKNSVSFSPEVQVQHDGKQNGIAQQAMQSGDIPRLSRVGAIYGDEENVVTEGDMRDFFKQNMFLVGIPLAMKEKPERLFFWKEFMKNVDAGNTKNIIKAIAKQPMMEVSYGRAIFFNMETASEIINGKEFEDLFVQDDDYSVQERIEDLNNIIAATLKETLDLNHQATLKLVGKTWSMLGVVPEMLGPNGNTIFMGSSEYVKTGNSIRIQTARGPVEIDLTERKNTGSARQRQRKRVLEPGQTKYTLQELTGFGQEVANQLPVLPIQQIDAAIMGETILDVNIGRMGKSLRFDSNIIDRQTNRPTDKISTSPAKGPAYLIPVHDAIITDASSVSDYHRTINNKFKEVNQRYSVAKAVYNGFVKQKNEVLNSINPDQQYNVGVEGNFRALHSRLLEIYNRVREGTTSYTNEEGVKVQIPSWENRNDQEIMKLLTGTESSWNPQGTGSMNGKILKKALQLAMNSSYLETRLKNWVQASEVNKYQANKAMKNLRMYTYN
jgi:hypothetical protein